MWHRKTWHNLPKLSSTRRRRRVAGSGVQRKGESLKYLVTVKRRDSVPFPPEAIAGILAGQRDFIREKITDGTFDAAYGFPQGGGGIAIVNADSAEELSDILTSSPVFAIAEQTVLPLAEIDVTLGNSIQAMQRATAVPA